MKSYLVKEALESAKELDDVEPIWKRLKDHFGDPSIMLKRKMAKIYTAANIGARKSANEVKDHLISLNNSITDVMKLVEEHNIGVELYGKYKVDDIVSKMPNWFAKSWDIEFLKIDTSIEDEQKWKKFQEFIEKQIKLQKLQAERDSAAKVVNKVEDKKASELRKSPGATVHFTGDGFKRKDSGDCILSCGQKHGKEVYECSKFLRVKKPNDRMDLLKKTKAYFCYQCLEKLLSSSSKKQTCSDKYSCPNLEHANYSVKLHVLICQKHCDDPANQNIFDEFKKEVLKSANWTSNVKLSFFSKFGFDAQNIHNHANVDLKKESNDSSIDEEVKDQAMFLLQRVIFDGKEFNIFFDDGCGSAVISKAAVDDLGDERVVKICSDPVEIGGVGKCKAVSNHGVYKFKLPLANQRQALFVGPCLEEITNPFPIFPLDKIVEEVKTEAFGQTNIVSQKNWPKFYSTCGGRTSIMIGQMYRRYYPVEVFRLPSGLSVLESHFVRLNGTRGVIGGPSKVVTHVLEKLYLDHQDSNLAQFYLLNFFSNQLKVYENGYKVDLDIKSFTFPTSLDAGEDCFLTRNERKFKEMDEAGSVVDYRCSRCRGCSLCINSDKLNAVSLQEEREQYLIEESVKVDFEKQAITVKFPLLADPKTSLGENKKAALKVYKQQIEKLNKNPKDKEDVLKSEKKMQDRGHVRFLSELEPEEKLRMERTGFSHFTPWRSVWNSNSMTTQCRVVFDMSAISETGLSLNDISPKGINQINNLIVVFTRWRLGVECMHTDITAMYPTLKLEPEYWGLQKYLWSNGLEPGVEPVVKIISSVMWGGRSAGNLAIAGVKKIASSEPVKEHFPRGSKTLIEEIYVDDILPEGQASKEDCQSLADEISGALATGGMSVKGVTFSGSNIKPGLLQ